MIKNSTTFINDSGIFTTSINLYKVLKYTPTIKNQEKEKEKDKETEKEFDVTSTTTISKVDWDKEGLPERNKYPSGTTVA